MTTATKKKMHVLLMSTHFMKDHPRAGDPTGFEQKILSREKIHTIRSNYDYWKQRIDEVNAGDAMLSVRKWTGKPYRSKQEELIRFDKVGFQWIGIRIKGRDSYCFVEGTPCFLDDIAENDGLSRKDFDNWFGFDSPALFSGAIIHFTNFRY